ncbi:hypothetical protein FIBSPDRAFT_902400 [Athelia psychrophila]|uniref:Uncharacterized protein n=1 Tax=Athelia psychrophila TaxID=1759441 RepID=A0A167X9F2_9AGAM|nr:hypothetical protein FIBSPDRAFT_902400 [Fibularhizoctonia sp. CBS 109695]
MPSRNLPAPPKPSRNVGRPRKRTYHRKQTSPSLPKDDDHPDPATPSSQKNPRTPPSSGASASPSMAELLPLKNNQPLFQSPDINPPDLTRLSLRKIARTPGNNWKLLESGIPTHALSEWFERHKNDFAIKEYHQAITLRQIWLDGAGDRPKDFRARRFAASFPPKDFEAEDGDEFDERYHNDDDSESEEGSDGSSDSSESEKGGPKTQRTRATNSTQACEVVLHVEITADRPGEAKVWQQYSHPDADPRALTWSLRLRRVATEDLSTLGGTATKVQKKFTKIYTDPQAWNIVVAEKCFVLIPRVAGPNKYRRAFPSLSSSRPSLSETMTLIAGILRGTNVVLM